MLLLGRCWNNYHRGDLRTVCACSRGTIKRWWQGCRGGRTGRRGSYWARNARAAGPAHSRMVGRGEAEVACYTLLGGMPVPFTVDDFQDLLRLLDQHPEWRAELRRHVLSDELLELPALTRQLAQHVDRLAEAQARTAEQLTTLTARVDALAEAQTGMAAQLGRLADRVESLADRVGGLSGKML